MGAPMDAVELRKFIRLALNKSKSYVPPDQYLDSFRKQLSVHPNDTSFMIDLEDKMITCTESECYVDLKFEFLPNGSIDFTPFRRHILSSELSHIHAERRDRRVEKHKSEFVDLTLDDDVKPSLEPSASSNEAGPSSSAFTRTAIKPNVQSIPSKKPSPDESQSVSAADLGELPEIIRRQRFAQSQIDMFNRVPEPYRSRKMYADYAMNLQILEQALADQAGHRQRALNLAAHDQPLAGPGPSSKPAIAATNPELYARIQAAEAEENARLTERARLLEQAADARAARNEGGALGYLQATMAGFYGVGTAFADGAARFAAGIFQPGPANDGFDWDEHPYGRGTGYAGRRPRGQVHSAEMDEFFKETAEAEMFEDNVTVDEAAKKLGLANQRDLLPNCTVRLMPHQLIGVAWMLEKEKSDSYGGILGDEMGLGKTVQAIALMASNESTDPKEKTTLIIAPLSLLRQWKREIEDKMVNNHWKVLIYHGSDPRRKDIRKVKHLREYDIVMTTYGTLVRDWEDEEDAFNKARKAASKKQRETGQAQDVDEHLKFTREPGLLFKMNWYRVIIDEGHTIRTKATKASRAVKELDALYRWVLTGTLIVNKHEDVYPLLRFLQIKMWSDWTHFRVSVVPPKDCDPSRLDESSKRLNAILKKIHMRRRKDSMLDGKPLLQLPEKTVTLSELEFSLEERNIYSQVEERAQVTFNKYLKAGTVLKNYAAILTLLLRLRQICFHPCLMVAEYDPEYDAKLLKAELDRALAVIGKAGVDKFKKAQLDKAVSRVEEGDTAEADECPICLEVATAAEGGASITQCGHIFCQGCLRDVLNSAQEEDDDAPGPRLKPDQRRCPICRTGVSSNSVFMLAAFEPDKKTLEKLKPELASTTDSEDEQFKMPKRAPALTSDDDGDESDESGDDSLDGFIVDGDEVETAYDSDDVRAKKKARTASTAKGKGKAKPITRSRQSNKPRRLIMYDSEADSDDFKPKSDDDVDELDPSSASEAKEELPPGPKKNARALTGDEKKAAAKAKRKREKAARKWRSEQEPSTKMRWCMAEIERIERDFPGDKVILISQWTSVLDMMEAYLLRNDIKVTRYQGDMSAKERDGSLLKFMTLPPERRRIMLLSLKCGGVGLNLTKANRVISLDLAWSPAVEAQAFDRVHRIGQDKPVQVDRLTIADSVEQRIGKLQERKQLIADGSLGEGDGQKMGRLTVAELAGLFGLQANGERQ